MTTKADKVGRLQALAKKGHTLVGPYDDGDGNPKYMILHKTTKRILATTRDKAVAEVIVPRWETDGGVLKVLSPQVRQAKKTSAAAAAPVKEFIEAKLDASRPIQYRIIAEASWDQNLYLTLGRMTYNKLLKLRELFPGDVWKFEFNEADQLAKNVESTNKIVETYASAIDYLVKGKESVKEIVRLEYELGLEGARLVRQRLRTTEAEIKAKFYEDYSRIVQACMCANDQHEFFERILVKGLLDAQSRGQIAASTQIAAKEEEKPA